MLSRKTKSSGHENITDRDDDETLSTDIAGPSNGNKSSGSRRVEMSWKDKLESLQSAIIVICSLLATCCFDAIISPPGGVWQTRPSKEVFQAETPKNISAFPKAFVSMNITSTDLLAPNKAMSLDRNGITPLHYAAINGNLHVVRELIFCCPVSAKETIFNGETLLHLVVKNNNRYEVVISLLSLLDEMDLINEIINYVDKDGNMILHLAVARKQQQTPYSTFEGAVLLFQYFHLGRRCVLRDFIDNNSFSYARNVVRQFLLAGDECDGGDIDDWLGCAALRKCLWLGYRYHMDRQNGLDNVYIVLLYLLQESQS
ncbi:hypothetical protein LWI29_022855 [Acer saccharum]|uniref:PGG domain-containing protein n=1 Tax=Acer saccharum TaxID=4024 RepID=A0AA39VTK6_ACESA|nr:hypothetical protein LWI29_022855 [Acer saccharum]